MIDQIVELVDLGDNGTTTLAEDNFAIRVDETDPDTFSGATFNVLTDVNSLDTFQEDSVSTDTQGDTGACSLSLPTTLFDDLRAGGVSLTMSRLSYTAFVDDALFQPRASSDAAREFTGYRVGSVIASASVVGVDRVSGLSSPVGMRFQIRQVCIHLCDSNH